MNREIIINEPFGNAIYQTIIQHNLRHNVEIGSWDGQGSTMCFINAMLQLSGDKSLHCIEINKQKFEQLEQNTKQYNFVFCFNCSSINYEQLIYKDFDTIWKSEFNKINKKTISRQQAQGWFDKDVESITQSSCGYLTNIYYSPQLLSYDSALIDGSEFTGYSEFVLLKDRTRVFFLDDVHHAFKCNQIYHELKQDNNWLLLQENSKVRNGFAIFIKK